MRLGTMHVPRRFRGPPRSSNGGYACGRLAAFLDGAAEVTLRRPPPLERDLEVWREDGGTVALRDGNLLIATAVATDLAVPDTESPGFAAAVAASERTFPPSEHKLPMCYVCGPDRAAGDGLRIFCGPLNADDRHWAGPVAAPWIPEAYMASGDAGIGAEFVWAALDCPTAFACGSPQGFPSILLGRQAVAIRRCPQVGEKCVITAKSAGREGRKYRAAASLYGENGKAIAACRATWIEVSGDVLVGADGG